MEGNHNIMSEPRNLESHGDMRKSFEGKDGSYFPKWRLPSKIRRKFRASDEDSASKEADHLNENNTSVDTHSPRNSLRACVDCNTTKTPLWRSGPQGPKSLCNACGIRHRKKRRALFASLGHDVVESVKPKKRTNSWDAATAIKKHNRSNKAREDDLDQMPLKLKLLAFCKGMEKDLYGNFSKGHSHASSSSSSSAIQRRFAQEEEEAARLLMAISYGLVLA